MLFPKGWVLQDALIIIPIWEFQVWALSLVTV
jgi:hypothetical protein